MLNVYNHTLLPLIGIGNTRHTAHDPEHIVIHTIHADLGSGGTSNRARREHKLEDGIVNTREVATATWLVLLRAKGK